MTIKSTATRNTILVALIAVSLFAFTNCDKFSGIEAGMSSTKSSIGSTRAFALSARKVWIHPNAESGLAADWNSVFDQMDEWTDVLNQTQVYQLFETGVAEYSQGQLQSMVAAFATHNVRISIEAEGLLPYTCGPGSDGGKVSGQQLLQDIKPIYDAGGHVDFISLDHSGIDLALANNGRPDNNCNYDLNTAFSELTTYMQTVHKVHPNIGFGLIANFPNYNFNGTQCYFAPSCTLFGGTDYKDVLGAIINTAASGGESFQFLHADNPYGYFSNHPGVSDVYAQRLLPLKAMAEGYGLRFGLILNSDLGGSADNTTNLPAKSQSYANDSMVDLQALAQHGGLDSADFIVESWFHFPGSVLGETDQYSFMWLADQMIFQYNNFLNAQSLSLPVANPAQTRLAPPALTDSTGNALVPGATYKLQSSVSGKCLDITNGAAANGTRVQQYCCNPVQQQNWKLEDNGDGTFSFINPTTGHLMDIDASTLPNNNAAVQEWTFNGGMSQKFYLNPMYNGGVEIASAAASGQCIDMNGNTLGTDGVPLRSWSCTGAANQTFLLIKN